MKIFLDNTTSIRLARAIHTLVEPKQTVHHLKDLFPQSTEDPVWLEELGKQGDWVVLSGDVNIVRKNSAERAAWEAAQLTTFFMARGFTKKKGIEQAAILMRLWMEIVRTAQTATQGTAFLVPLKGKKISEI